MKIVYHKNRFGYKAIKIKHKNVETEIGYYEALNSMQIFNNLNNVEIFRSKQIILKPLNSKYQKPKQYEYVTQCSNCGNKNIYISHKRKPFKAIVLNYCVKCRKNTKQIVIGRIIKQYKRWNTLKIRYYKNKTKIPNINLPKIAYPSFFEKLYGCSSYNGLTETIRLYYHKSLNNDLAFQLLINDVNHEFTHHLLDKWINSEISLQYDNLDIAFNLESLYLQIGFKNPNAFKTIIKQFPRLKQYVKTKNAYKPINTITIN